MSINSLPYFAVGEVVRGFGRGSKQLGIPTANYPSSVVSSLPSEIETGVYFGFARVENGPIYRMLTSVGWNPYFQNKEKSVETHILHNFADDFYGQQLRIIMVGYIRNETNFNSMEELIKAIKDDIRIAQTELDKKEYQGYQNHEFFNSEKVN